MTKPQPTHDKVIAHPKVSCDKCGHKSDCSLHNEPAFPNEPCDCKAIMGVTE